MKLLFDPENNLSGLKYRNRYTKFINLASIIFRTETMRRCGFFLEVFGLSMPDYLQCDIFPESMDTDVCLGNREVKEVRFRASKAGDVTAGI